MIVHTSLCICRSGVWASVVSVAVVLNGCGGSSTASATSTPALAAVPPAAGGATSVYVISDPTYAGSSPYAILQLPAAANGNPSPTSTLYLPSGFAPLSLALDSSGQIYVSGSVTTSSAGEVLIYASGASGTAAPVRTITGVGDPANSVFPYSLCVDSTGLLYVASSGASVTTVAVFSNTANGATTPLRLIQSTVQGAGHGLATDASQNLYVGGTASSGGVIAVYSSSASGNATPTRTVTGSTGFGAIAVDAAGDIYAMAANGIVEFAPGASGAATPLKTISGSATQIVSYGLALDKAGNVYSANQPFVALSNETESPYVTGFGPSASGNIAPSVYITSSTWTFALYSEQIAAR